MVEIVEVKHTPINEGKEQVQKILQNETIKVPRCAAPQVIDGRWRMLLRGERSLEPEVEKMVKAALEAISENVKITTQRNIYYTIRGKHPDWKFNGMDLNEDKVYNALTGTIMEDVQLATDRTMQSLGVWAAPRGYITGDGYIYSERRGRVPLTAMPAIQFDLCDEGVTVVSKARKIIHFEKDAGFEGIAGHDNAVMLETQYSTSQGYPVESANKYLADCQNRGLKVYVVHDADPHGCFTRSAYVVKENGIAHSIKEIEVGTSLYTLDNNNDLVTTKVVAKSERWVPADEILVLEFLRPRIKKSGQKSVKVLVTKNHPFNVVGKGWVEAGNLKLNDVIVEAGELVANKRTRVEKRNLKGLEKYRDTNIFWMKTASRKGAEKYYPSKLELILLGLFTYHELPIDFVGNKLQIGGIYPDFRVRNSNKLIEVGSKTFLQFHKMNYEERVKQRTEIYEREGYKVLFINADEENLGSILKKVKEFITNGATLVKISKVYRQLSHLIEYGEAKKEKGKLWTKVYNLQCEPYNSYLVDSLHVHNCQMMLMYGMASKNNAYMPSSFYPAPQSVILLGLFPRVALGLDLPAEKVGETHKAIIPNLLKIVEEHPMMKEEVQVIAEQSKQWEFQALNGLSPNAPPIYLVEALRVKGDEIKHVPDSEEVKKIVVDEVRENLEGYVENKLDSFVQRWFDAEHGLKEQIVAKLKELLKTEIDEFNMEAHVEIGNLETLPAENFREAVKLELVKDPKRYWDDAARSIVNEILDRKFEIEAEPKITLELEAAKVEKEVTVAEPEIPEKPLNKDDIVASIEKKIVGRAEQRDKLVAKIRETLEKIFGVPDLKW